MTFCYMTGPFSSSIWVLLIFILLDSPVLSTSSSTNCSIHWNAALFEKEGTTKYTYNYKSFITTTIGEWRPMSEAHIHIYKSPSGGQLLTVQDAVIKIWAGELKEPLSLNDSPILYMLDGEGAVQDSCVSRDDPPYSANFKRSILSLLQDRNDSPPASDDDDRTYVTWEVGLTGNCSMEYRKHSWGTYKTRNESSCHIPLNNDPDKPMDPPSVHRNELPSESPATTTSTIQPSMTCILRYEKSNGTLTSIECWETHINQTIPFLDSNRNTYKHRTTITTKLTLTSSQKEGFLNPLDIQNYKSSSLLFDFNEESSNSSIEIDASLIIRNKLQEICLNLDRNDNDDDSSSKLPPLLSDLKNSLRRASSLTIQEIYDELKGADVCPGKLRKLRKLYVDMAALSGTTAGWTLLANLYSDLLNNDLDDLTKLFFHLSTSLASNPTIESLQFFLNLLKNNPRSEQEQLLLTASGIAQRYCHVTNPECGKVSEYIQIGDEIARIAGESCAVVVGKDGKKEMVKLAISALNSLGNLNKLTEKGVSAILECLSVDLDRIKVAALESFRRDPCQVNLRKRAQEIFANDTKSANVRISAFLSKLHCLLPDDLILIQTVLDDENSIQLGEFLQSRLQFLSENASPGGNTLNQSVAKDLVSKLKFPKNLKKLSRHIHSSYFNPDWNFGYSAQANALFSEDSFIPKQIWTNLTLDQFGQSYNILQLGLYLENFDFPLESIFHNLDNPTAFLQNIRCRSKGGLNDPPGVGDLNIRILGTTVASLAFTTANLFQSNSTIFNDFSSILKSILHLNSRTFSTELFKPIELSKVDIPSTPTIAGFAISLATDFYSISSLSLSRDFSKSENNLEFSLKIDASWDTSLRIRHAIRLGPFEHGIQHLTTLKSGGSLDFSLAKGKRDFDVKVNFPRNNLLEFEFNSGFQWIKRSPLKGDVVVVEQVDGMEEWWEDAYYRDGYYSGWKEAEMVRNETCHTSKLNKALTPLGLQFCFGTNFHEKFQDDVLFGKNRYFLAKLKKYNNSFEGYHYSRRLDETQDEVWLNVTFDMLPDNRWAIKFHRDFQNDGRSKTEIILDAPPSFTQEFPGEPLFKFEYEQTEPLTEITAKFLHSHETAPSAYNFHASINEIASSPSELTKNVNITLNSPSSAEKNYILDVKLLVGKIVKTFSQNSARISFDLTYDTGLHLPAGITTPLNLKGSVQFEETNSHPVKWKIGHLELSHSKPEGQMSTILIANVSRQVSNSLTHTKEFALDAHLGHDLEHTLSIQSSSTITFEGIHITSKMASSIPQLNLDCRFHFLPPTSHNVSIGFKLTYLLPLISGDHKNSTELSTNDLENRMIPLASFLIEFSRNSTVQLESEFLLHNIFHVSLKKMSEIGTTEAGFSIRLIPLKFHVAMEMGRKWTDSIRRLSGLIKWKPEKSAQLDFYTLTHILDSGIETETILGILGNKIELNGTKKSLGNPQENKIQHNYSLGFQPVDNDGSSLLDFLLIYSTKMKKDIQIIVNGTIKSQGSAAYLEGSHKFSLKEGNDGQMNVEFILEINPQQILVKSKMELDNLWFPRNFSLHIVSQDEDFDPTEEGVQNGPPINGCGLSLDTIGEEEQKIRKGCSRYTLQFVQAENKLKYRFEGKKSSRWSENYTTIHVEGSGVKGHVVGSIVLKVVGGVETRTISDWKYMDLDGGNQAELQLNSTIMREGEGVNLNWITSKTSLHVTNSSRIVEGTYSTVNSEKKKYDFEGKFKLTYEQLNVDQQKNDEETGWQVKGMTKLIQPFERYIYIEEYDEDRWTNGTNEWTIESLLKFTDLESRGFLGGSVESHIHNSHRTVEDHKYFVNGDAQWLTNRSSEFGFPQNNIKLLITESLRIFSSGIHLYGINSKVIGNRSAFKAVSKVFEGNGFIPSKQIKMYGGSGGKREWGLDYCYSNKTSFTGVIGREPILLKGGLKGYCLDDENISN